MNRRFLAALAYALLGLWILYIGRNGPQAFCVVMGLLFLTSAALRGLDAAGVPMWKYERKEKP